MDMRVDAGITAHHKRTGWLPHESILGKRGRSHLTFPESEAEPAGSEAEPARSLKRARQGAIASTSGEGSEASDGEVASKPAAAEGVKTRGPITGTSAPTGSSTRHIFRVQRPGSERSALLAAQGDTLVGFLLEDIKKKLPSLHEVDEDSITLRLATDDGKVVAVKGAASNGHVTLDIMDTVDEVLKKAFPSGSPAARKDNLKLRIIVDVAGPRPVAAAGASSISDLPALPDTHIISQVVAAIRSGLVTESSDEGAADMHLRLPAGMSWPNATNNVLFVREFYAPLLEKVLGWCRAAKPGELSSTQRRIVTGQPGIGKSVWIWYVIYRLLRSPVHKGRTIILAIQETQEGFVIAPTGPLRRFSLSKVGLEDFNHLLDLGAEPLVIADSLLPPVLSMPTLVVSSPGRLAKRDLSNMLNSYNQNWCYMLIPTPEEVLRMRAACFSHLDEEGVKLRMMLWGPIPRHVLVYVSPLEQLRAWTKAASVALETLVALARGRATRNAGVGDSDEVGAPHHLLHERAAGQDAEPNTPAADVNNLAYYARGKVILASPAMMRYLAERLVEEGNWNAKFLIDASVGIRPLGALRGLKFEELVLKMLEDGTEFECRRLLKGGRCKAKRSAAVAASAAASAARAPAVSTSAFSPSTAAASVVTEEDDEEEGVHSVQATPRVIWSKATELPAHRGIPSLLVPGVRNEAGLDALIWDAEAGHHWPLDCTSNKLWEQHNVHAQGVSDAVRALGWTPAKGWPDHDAKKGAQHIKYFWVLPEDRYKNWWSPQAAKVGSDSSPEAKEVFEKLWQYALCVPPAATTKQVAQTLKEQGVKMPVELVGAGNVAGAAGRDAAE